MAMTAWAAKFVSSSRCFSRTDGPPGGRWRWRPPTRPSFSIRHVECGSRAAECYSRTGRSIHNVVVGASRILVCMTRDSGDRRELAETIRDALESHPARVRPRLRPNGNPRRRSEQDTELGLTQTDGVLQHAWNTGSKSPGDELMTRSTSAVAVCCSSDSRSSVSSRAFSMAMTACAAKFSLVQSACR